MASRCMRGVLAHLERSRYVSVTLTAGQGLEGFYRRFGFHVIKAVTLAWQRGTETIGEAQ
jgi:hypothetical protein